MNNELDLNGFKLSESPTSSYLGVYFDAALGLYVAGTKMRKGIEHRYKSATISISKHSSILEAAWYYQQFTSNVEKHIRELEYVGQYNWSPCKNTPLFKYGVIGKIIDVSDIDITKSRHVSACQHIKKSKMNISSIWKDNTESSNMLLNKLLLTGKEALDIILKCKGKTIKDLPTSTKSVLKRIVTSEEVNALDILTKINVMV